MKRIVRTLAVASTLAALAASAQDPAFKVEDARLGEGPITVEQKRDPVDARIQADAMSRLRAMQHIEGIVGVETFEGTVRLTGKVTTAAQALRAGREVRNVAGVRDVDNEIRSRVGSTF